MQQRIGEAAGVVRVGSCHWIFQLAFIFCKVFAFFFLRLLLFLCALLCCTLFFTLCVYFFIFLGYFFFLLFSLAIYLVFISHSFSSLRAALLCFTSQWSSSTSFGLWTHIRNLLLLLFLLQGVYIHILLCSYLLLHLLIVMLEAPQHSIASL